MGTSLYSIYTSLVHLKKLFKFKSEIHDYGTRSSTNENLALYANFKTSIGTQMLKIVGSKTLNMLKSLVFYRKCFTKKSFIKKCKDYLLNF